MPTLFSLPMLVPRAYPASSAATPPAQRRDPPEGHARNPTFWAVAVSLVLIGLWVQWAADNPAWMRFFHHNRVLPEAFWANLTLLGFGWAILIFVGTLDRRDGRGTLAALLALVAGGLLVQLVKSIFGVARPALALLPGDLSVIGVPVLYSGSMPSGHAAAAGATVTLLVLLLRERHWLTPWLLTAVAGLFALVAWSRVAVGAHWPADVLVGSGLGMMCGALSWRAANRLLGRAGSGVSAAVPATGQHLRQRWLWMCACDLLAAALCLGDNCGYPQAVALQQVLGALAVGSAMLRLHLWWRSGQRT